MDHIRIPGACLLCERADCLLVGYDFMEMQALVSIDDFNDGVANSTDMIERVSEVEIPPGPARIEGFQKKRNVIAFVFLFFHCSPPSCPFYRTGIKFG
jgi:hypothetical protein